MPYPLPDNVGGVTGLKYYLVAVPDDPAYSRAALGAYTELGNFWQWGLEGPVPGDSDLAAQQWQTAIAETIRLIQMAWPDTVLGHIDGLETLLQAILDKDSCCEGGFIGEELNDPDGIVGIDDENIPGDDVVWGVGDPPGDAADWDEATLERCAQAENFAANLYRWIGLSEALQEVGEVVSVILFVGAVAAFLPAIGLTAIAGALSIGTVYSFMQLLQTALSAGPDFTAARNELQDPDTVDAVVCAIIQASTAAAAESAIDSALASNAPNAYPMLRALPLRFIMGALFNDGGTAGGFGGPCRDCTGDLATMVGGYKMTVLEAGGGLDNSGVFLRSNDSGGNTIHVGTADIGRMISLPWCVVESYQGAGNGAYTCFVENTNVKQPNAANKYLFFYVNDPGAGAGTWRFTIDAVYIAGVWEPVVGLDLISSLNGTVTITGNEVSVAWPGSGEPQVKLEPRI